MRLPFLVKPVSVSFSFFSNKIFKLDRFLACVFIEQKKLLKRQHSLGSYSASCSSEESNSLHYKTFNKKSTKIPQINTKPKSAEKATLATAKGTSTKGIQFLAGCSPKLNRVSNNSLFSFKLAVSNCGSSVKSVGVPYYTDIENREENNLIEDGKNRHRGSNKKHSTTNSASNTKNSVDYTSNKKSNFRLKSAKLEKNSKSLESLNGPSLEIFDDNTNMFNLNNLSNTTGYYVPPYNHYATYLPQSTPQNVKSASIVINNNNRKTSSSSEVKRSKSLSGSINLSLISKDKVQ